MTRINDKDTQPESLKEINDRMKQIRNEFPMKRFYSLKSKWQLLKQKWIIYFVDRKFFRFVTSFLGRRLTHSVIIVLKTHKNNKNTFSLFLNLIYWFCKTAAEQKQ